MDIKSERNVQGTFLSCERNLQRTDRCWQDRDHTDGHYITLPLFAEQLTRTFEVLVIKMKVKIFPSNYISLI